MKISIITTPDKFSSEIPVVIKLFNAGLETLHLRKTKFSTRKLKEYLDLIPQKYHSRIIIHSHHHLSVKYNLKGIHFTRTHLKNKFKCRIKMLWYRLRKPGITITRSFHHLESLNANRIRYTYVFLNPFFSKTEVLKSHFDINTEYLNKIIDEYPIPVYASGNITGENLHELKKYRLHGVAVSKLIWESQKTEVDTYNSVKELLQRNRAGE